LTTGTDSKILKMLEEWQGKEGALPQSLEFYRGLLRIQSEARSRFGVPRLGLSEEAISNRIKGGVPLLGFDDLSIDWALLRNIFEEVTALVTSYSEVWGEVPEKLKDSGSCLALLKDASKAWFEGAQLAPRMAVSGVNGALLEFMLQAALRPFLMSHCEALLGFVKQEQWWRGYCPICGGNPDFAFLDKERGARWLLCSRCDAEWLFRRLECPYCGTQDQGALAYFTDDEGLYRLYVCERCRHYLKTIDLRQAGREVLLPLERFLTLDIDIQAHKNGYSPCAKAGGGEGMKRQWGATLLAREES